MLLVELRLALFLILLLLIVTAGVAAWLARRRSVAGAHQGEASLLALLEGAPLGVLVAEAQRCTFSNAYAQRLLHLAPESSTLPAAEWGLLLDEDRSAARQSGGARQRTITLPPERTVRWWVTAWGPRDFIFLLDLTAQQQAEQAGHALMNDLAHELRTPIATLLTHLEILGLDDLDAELVQQSLTLSKEEAQRMARLVNDMLELGRLETAPALVRRPVDLQGLVEEVVLQVTPRAVERQMDLGLEVEGPLPLVNGDADRLRQVFLNLLDNALKYARPGDHVRVGLRREETGVACSVCDTGPGIPAEHLPYIPRRFYRVAPRSVEGSGLGLAVVDEILRRHESRLELESHTQGEMGTCARFVLPVK